jgi:hypothetical protein
MILFPRLCGWLLLFLGLALAVVDLQLSGYHGRFMLRSNGAVLDMFGIAGATSFDYGLHPASWLWRFFLGPLVEMPAAGLLVALGTITLACFRKRTRFVEG